MHQLPHAHCPRSRPAKVRSGQPLEQIHHASVFSDRRAVSPVTCDVPGCDIGAVRSLQKATGAAVRRRQGLMNPNILNLYSLKAGTDRAFQQLDQAKAEG